MNDMEIDIPSNDINSTAVLAALPPLPPLLADLVVFVLFPVLVGIEDSEGPVEGYAEGIVDAEGLVDTEGLADADGIVDAEGLVDTEGVAVKIASPPTPLKAFHRRLGENISISASTPPR
jgi:hypothetical protein